MGEEEKPFTFDFGDGVKVTAEDVPEGPQKRLMEEIAETMGGLGIAGIRLEEDKDDAESD